jgi:AcrR family transcriptional regulator
MSSPASTQPAPRERLTPESVARRAVALADAEGLDAVTVRRLAQDLGVTPMALYRHFSDKDALLDAMAECLLADVAVPESRSGAWDKQMREVLDAFLAALRPHPNVAELTLHTILTSTPGLVLAERVLELLADAGFPAEHAAEVGTYALCSLVTLVTTEPGRAERGGDAEAYEDTIRAKRATLASLSPARYPHVVAAADALADCANDDAYYRLGADLVVAGMQGVSRRSRRSRSA